MPTIPKSPCAVCGLPVPTNGRQRAKYCSTKCRKFGRAVELASRRLACSLCGREFTPTSGRSRFCSVDCRQESARLPAPKAQRPKVFTARLRPDFDDVVPVQCWCQRRIVGASLDDVRAGLGASCGRPDCSDPR